MQPTAEPPPARKVIPSYSETGCFPDFEKGRARARVEPPPPVPVVETPLTGAEVVDGFRAIERTVQECRPAGARPDPISVHAAIAKDGKVSTVVLRGQFAAATASCIENAVKGARFRASSGLAADYVFLFRRVEAGTEQGRRDGGVDGGRDGSAG